MWGKVLTGIALAGSAYVYSCSNSNDPKREEERARLIQENQNERNRVISESCRTSVRNVFLQIKPLVMTQEDEQNLSGKNGSQKKDEFIQKIPEGTEMRAIYFRDLINTPKSTDDYGGINMQRDLYGQMHYGIPIFYEVDSNSLAITEIQGSGKNKRTVDISKMPVYPSTIRYYREQYSNCLRNWKG